MLSSGGGRAVSGLERVVFLNNVHALWSVAPTRPQRTAGLLTLTKRGMTRRRHFSARGATTKSLTFRGLLFFAGRGHFSVDVDRFGDFTHLSMAGTYVMDPSGEYTQFVVACTSGSSFESCGVLRKPDRSRNVLKLCIDAALIFVALLHCRLPVKARGGETCCTSVPHAGQLIVKGNASLFQHVPSTVAKYFMLPCSGTAVCMFLDCPLSR